MAKYSIFSICDRFEKFVFVAQLAFMVALSIFMVGFSSFVQDSFLSGYASSSMVVIYLIGAIIQILGTVGLAIYIFLPIHDKKEESSDESKSL